jgi:hypothetical protein
MVWQGAVAVTMLVSCVAGPVIAEYAKEDKQRKIRLVLLGPGFPLSQTFLPLL